MDFSFFFLIFFLVFVYFEPGLFFPVVGDIRLAFLVAITALLFAVATGKRLRISGRNKYFVLFLALAGLSLPFSISIGTSLDDTILLFKSITLYFLIVMIIQSKEQLQKLISIINAFGFITSVPTLVLSKFDIFKPGIADPYRMASFFGGIGDGPNQFGALMVGLLPLPFVMMDDESSKAKKILLILIALSFMLCITRTRSRGAFVGLVVVVGCLLWENRKRFGILILFAALALFTYTHTHYRYWTRISTLQSEEAIMAEGSARNRVYQMKYAWEIMMLRPLTGVGLGNFSKAKIHFLDLDPRWKVTRHVAHNSYLELGAEIGILGMILFLYLVYRSIKDCYKNERRFSDDVRYRRFQSISKGIRIGLIGFAVSIFFLSEQYNSLLYQWFAIITILGEIAEREFIVGNANPMSDGHDRFQAASTKKTIRSNPSTYDP
jgi:O-antigen ligase